MGYTYRDGTPVEQGFGYCPHRSTRFVNNDASSVGSCDGLPELYTDRSECCGCTACATGCPASAITMEMDEEGFLYPVVDAAKCLRCGRCLKACSFKLRLTEWN